MASNEATVTPGDIPIVHLPGTYNANNLREVHSAIQLCANAGSLAIVLDMSRTHDMDEVVGGYLRHRHTHGLRLAIAAPSRAITEFLADNQDINIPVFSSIEEASSALTNH